MVRSILFWGTSAAAVLLLFASCIILAVDDPITNEAGAIGLMVSLVCLVAFMMLPFPKNNKA